MRSIYYKGIETIGVHYGSVASAANQAVAMAATTGNARKSGSFINGTGA